MSICHCSHCDPATLCPHGIALYLGNECRECNEQWDKTVKELRTDIGKHEASLYSLRDSLEHLTGVRR